MSSRKKVAVFIDYSIRIPNFKKTFEDFKSDVFSDKGFGIDTQDKFKKDDVRFYWQRQTMKPEVEEFYVKVKLPENDYDLRGKDLSKFFFNEEHYLKFMDEYSFNLYGDCEVPNLGDIDVLNIAQRDLLEVVVVDRYQSRRKISNTFFFLSKNRIYPQAVMFLGQGQELNTENYFAIWDPSLNDSQINAQKDKKFLNWFMDLEKKINEQGK